MLRPMKNADRRPLPVRIFRFYYDGFREMTLGRTLWAIIGEIVRNELIKHGLETQN